MRALVTGATGFIGTHVVAALREAGHSVVALVRPTSDRARLTEFGANFCVGDVQDAASLSTAVSAVDAVFHLASLLKMPWSPDFHAVNVDGTAAVAAAAAAAPRPPVLVVVSSLAAAGPARTGPRREVEDPEPVSRYGAVKLAAERAAIATGAPLSVVRPPLVYGEGDRTVLGLFRSVQRGFHVLPTWRSHPVSLVHARDLAEALVRIAEAGERVGAAPGSGVYHVAGDETLEYADLGGRVAAAVGCAAPRVVRLPGALTWAAAASSEAFARWRGTPAFLNLDKHREITAGAWTCANEKARSLGWTPVDLDRRLRQTAEAYRAQGWLA